MEEKERLFTKDFFLAWFARFFCTTVFLMLMATIAPYAMDTYGVGSGEAGLASGAYVLAATVCRIFAGRGVDSLGRRKSIIWGSVLYGFLTALYLAPMSFGLFVALRAAHGFIFGWVSTAINVVGVEVLPRSRMGEGVGYYSLGSCIAFGQFFGVLVFQLYDSAILFISVFAVCVLQLLCCLFVKVIEVEDVDGLEQGDAEPPEHGEDAPEQPSQGFSIFTYIDKHALPLATVAAISSIAYSSITAFIEPFTAGIGISEYASWYFIVYSVVLCIVRPPIGKLVDKGYEKPLMTVAFFMFCACYVVLALCQNGAMCMLSAILLAIGFSGANSNMLAIILKETPRKRTSLATATFFLLVDCGIGIGPAILGVVVESIGYVGMFYVDAVITIALVALYLYIRRKIPPCFRS